MRYLPPSASALLLVCVAAYGADWARWMGPRQDNRSDEKLTLANWGKSGPKVVWRAELGRGYASVTVSAERVYAVGNEGDKDTVFCLDEATGAVKWRYSYACRSEGGGFPGPAAAPTIDGDRVYVVSREGHVLCLEVADGRLVWMREPKSLTITRGASFWHGAACHPVVYGELLLLEIGTQAGNLVALDKATGATRWSSDGGKEGKLGYASPVLAKLYGKDVLVSLTGGGLVGVEAADGKMLFAERMRVNFQCPCATPLVLGSRIWVSSDCWREGSALFEVGPDFKLKRVWTQDQFKAHTATPVAVDGHGYGFSGSIDRPGGALKCVDLATGAVKWSKRDLMGHVTAAERNLVILTLEGELVFAEASSAGYRELRRARVLPGPSWTQPVVANGRVYVRNQAGRLLCIDPARADSSAPAGR